MTDFSEKCIRVLCLALSEIGQSDTQFKLIHGKKEDYWSAKLAKNDSTVDLYIYEDEAGCMIGEKEWSIFERPDFDSDDELIQAYVSHVMQLMGSKGTRIT
jgi:hypothetical protein